jgi:hypothetical protein
MYPVIKNTTLRRARAAFAAITLLSISSALAKTPFHGGDIFSIAVLPDTQYYTSENMVANMKCLIPKPNG